MGLDGRRERLFLDLCDRMVYAIFTLLWSHMRPSSHDNLFGLHALESLLQHHPQQILELWADAKRHDHRLQAVLELAAAQGIKIQAAERATLDKLASGGNHQGVVARCKIAAAYQENALPDLIQSLTHPPLLLVLDGVQDPHNLGACLRTAEAAGVDAVIAPKDRAVGLSATVRKVASGAAERVPLVQVTNLVRSLRTLQELGVWVIGTDSEAEQTVFNSKLSGSLALVLGAEGSGLRRLTRETCDALIKIPMRGAIESLNVSAAAAVCLFEAVRQRHY
jgi:23S rRNA (guanosine2251-2'-O)-methyltransferase